MLYIKKHKEPNNKPATTYINSLMPTLRNLNFYDVKCCIGIFRSLEAYLLYL
jgi:hypothetical protein